MKHFTMKVAGKTVAVRTVYESTALYCGKYLTDTPPELSLTVTEADIAREREYAARERQVEGLPPYVPQDAQLEPVALLRKLTQELIAYNTLLLHGSVVAVDGAAYLFTAKSGTGKSTHTRLWRELLGQRAVMVNDDKPFLRIEGDGVLACGSPWSGKHRLDTDTAVTLRAICILERGQVNEICPISPAEALPMLLQQTSRPADPARMGRYLELIDRLSRAVSFYRLRCDMTTEAAKVAYEAMRAEGPV